ncbi:LuxR C-terminal-related transcriptional regulator [Aliarcobacter cryaerophilus]|uniref:LuxR C-terminal-related transcriptional regulator n=1 Tax=Aliarcobacter cryaerophilus TaxID=28198 RepID=UPI0021B5B3A4|nr:LuxR C-terminal-related transcriptional regulator [Aliarcobacter cryaerophilus]MCT7529128.1 LuxR C-terminal-related transcriptional regulator [Aliarcobacter cryaerophilus]
MKKISLYTNLKRDYEKMKNSLSGYDFKNIEKIEELLTLKDNIVIINSSVKLDKEEESIEILLENRNKILILDSAPKLINAQNWLTLGVHGYGNSMMNDVYLKSAIETIDSGLIWLIPDITMEILSKLNSDSLNQKDVLNQLSKAEQQVAILLKDGLSNTKISEELKLSINTVKSHIKNIYLKLEVKDRFSFINLLNKK